MNKEKLENEIIQILRYFSENNYHNHTTGFQRYYAKDIIKRVVRALNE